MEIEGMIVLVLEPEGGTSQRTGNPWKKCGYVLETVSGQYPRRIKFDVWGDKADTMKFEQGKTYAVSVDIESREFNGRWYTDVKAYSSREVAPGQTMAQGSQQTAYGQPQFGQPQAPAQNPYSQPQFGQPQAPAQNPFGASPAPDFSQGDSQEDLPF